MAPARRRDRVDYITNVSIPPPWTPPTENFVALFQDILKDSPGILKRVSEYTKEEREEWHEALVRAIFQLANLEVSTNNICYQACLAKCTETRVLQASTWSTWGGTKDVKSKLEVVDDWTTLDGYLHVLNAPSLVTTMIVKCIRGIHTNGSDDGARRLKIFHQFNYLNFAIENYKPGVWVIATDIPFTVDPNEPKPRPTALQKEMMEVERAEMDKLKKELQEKARQERLQKEQPALTTDQAFTQAGQSSGDNQINQQPITIKPPKQDEQPVDKQTTGQRFNIQPIIKPLKQKASNADSSYTNLPKGATQQPKKKRVEVAWNRKDNHFLF